MGVCRNSWAFDRVNSFCSNSRIEKNTIGTCVTLWDNYRISRRRCLYNTEQMTGLYRATNRGCLALLETILLVSGHRAINAQQWRVGPVSAPKNSVPGDRISGRNGPAGARGSPAEKR